MFDAVAAARRAGIRTGLVSNSWGEEGYDRARFDELFDVLVISGELGIRKPAPEIYALAAERLERPAGALRVRRRPARQPQAGRGARDGDGAAPRRGGDDPAARGAARRQPALIATTPASASTTPTSCTRRDALGEHDAREHDGDRRVERAEHRDHRQQPLRWWRARRGRWRRGRARPIMPSTAKLGDVARERRPHRQRRDHQQHERAAALDDDHPRHLGGRRRLSMPTKNVAEPRRRHQRQPDRGAVGRRGALLDRLARGEDHARPARSPCRPPAACSGARPRPARPAPAPRPRWPRSAPPRSSCRSPARGRTRPAR